MIDQPSMRAAVDEVVELDKKVISAAIVSHDGLVMVATGMERERSDTLAAVSSEVLTKGKLVAEELGHGAMHGQVVLGHKGGLVVRQLNEEMVLVTELEPGANLGQIYAGMNRIGKKFG